MKPADPHSAQTVLDDARDTRPSLVLHVPDSPTTRELDRAQALSRSLGARIAGITAAERTAHHDALLGDERRRFFPLTGDPGAGGGPGPILSVSVGLPTELVDGGMAAPLWTFVEGNPRAGYRDSISRAIHAGSPKVTISLCRFGADGQQLRPLALRDAPRRPWDSLETLERRLDGFLPQLAEDVCDAAETADGEGPFPLPDPVSPAPAANPGERARDVRFFLGRVCSVLASLPGPPRDTRIVMFHNPVPDILDENLHALSRHGPFLPYSRTVSAALAGEATPRGIVVTFDDGYRENMSLLDVLERHRCSAMFFISTAAVDNDSALWFMNPDRDARSRKGELSSLSYRSFLEAISSYGFTAPSRLRGRLGLRSEEIREIVARGHEVGLHTHNHPFLTRLTRDEAFQELDLCRRVLSEALGASRPHWDVAYPDGAYDSGIYPVLDALGARSACSVLPGRLAAGVDRYALPRHIVDDSDYPGFALFRLTPLYRVMKAWRDRIRRTPGTREDPDDEV